MIKNAALSQMRLDQAVQLHDQYKSQLISSVKLKPKELENTRNLMFDAVTKYLNNFYRNEDTDYPIFHDYLHKAISEL